jgi:hypothetical protein
MPDDILFVIIDVTTLRECHIVCVCNFDKASKVWEVMKGQGRKFIGPQLDTFESGLWKSGSGLDTEQLRALYKNEMGKEPPNDNAQLAEAVAGIVERHSIDNSLDTIPVLTTPRTRQPRAEGGPATRPQSGVTLRVWDIADAIVAEVGTPKDLRAEIIAECTAQGINSATAATQYSRWFKNRRANATT